MSDIKTVTTTINATIITSVTYRRTESKASFIGNHGSGILRILVVVAPNVMSIITKHHS